MKKITKKVFEAAEKLVKEWHEDNGRNEAALQEKATQFCLKHGIEQSLDEWVADHREEFRNK